MFNFDVSMKRNKSTIIFLWFLVIFSFALIGIHFLPYFYSINSQTGQVYLEIRGIEVAFGRINRYGLYSINGNIATIAGIVLGSIGALSLLIFTIWFLVTKKYNRFMFFILSLSVPCFAALLAEEFFMVQLYKNTNTIGFTTIIFLNYWYYISLISSGLLFLLTFITIIMIAFSGSKQSIFVNEE